MAMCQDQCFRSLRQLLQGIVFRVRQSRLQSCETEFIREGGV